LREVVAVGATAAVAAATAVGSVVVAATSVGSVAVATSADSEVVAASADLLADPVWVGPAWVEPL
jgi:hypothetical protein